jgi:hypothetical protein
MVERLHRNALLASLFRGSGPERRSSCRPCGLRSEVVGETRDTLLMSGTLRLLRRRLGLRSGAIRNERLRFQVWGKFGVALEG